jgi:glycosyltransferase involved in cell wall biosynthesis
MRTIVISAVNLVEGGTLKVLQDCLREVRQSLPDWRIVALVNNRNVVNTDGIEIMEMPEPKTSWLKRIFAEYFQFKKISKKINPDIWWSLHDMTPNVKAKSRFVYCHNPTPFFRFTFKQLWLEPKLILFSGLYSLFYKINIKSNRAVIVQQDWLRHGFKRMYGVREVIVAHPVENQVVPALQKSGPIKTFVYPSLSRVFKNFELIAEAARLLESEADWQGQIMLTINPTETRLARDLYRRYGNVRGLHFIGRQDRAAMTKLYEQMDCLLFPSRLETWGLPISETKSLGKPMIVADLPYAYETVGSYDQARFVDPDDPRALADIMRAAHRDGWVLQPVKAAPVAEPFANNWSRLIELIVALHEQKHLNPSLNKR